MPIKVAYGFTDRLGEHCDQATVVLRGGRPEAFAVPAMEAARRRLRDVPHPEQPGEPFVHYVSEIEVGPKGPTFMLDAADAGGFPGILEALLSAIQAGLSESGLVDGMIDCR